MHVFDSSNILVVGGKTWERSVAYRSHDGGQQWQSVSLEGRGMYALETDASGLVYGCGLDKRLSTFTPDRQRQYVFGDYAAFKGLDAWDDDHIILAGGESIIVGYLFRASLKRGVMEEMFSLKREMNVVHCVDSLRWLAAGFGIVMRSSDGGLSWDTLDVRGEHFLDLCTVHDSVYFMCGIGGSIYRSYDYGEHWSTLRDATRIFVTSKPLRCICFGDEMNGLVAGEGGLVWRTRDGGHHWISLEGLPCVDYLDIRHFQGRYWLCGSQGTIVSVELP